MLRLVIPKGSLEDATLRLLEDAALRLCAPSDRDYFGRIEDPRVSEVAILRPQEIPLYVRGRVLRPRHHGARLDHRDGRRRVSRSPAELLEATDKPIRVVLAVRADAPWESVADLPDDVKVSTELPELTQRWFDERGKKVKVFLSYGATEAKVGSIVDRVRGRDRDRLRRAQERTEDHRRAARLADRAIANGRRRRIPTSARRWRTCGRCCSVPSTHAGGCCSSSTSSVRTSSVLLEVLPSFKAPTVNELAHQDGYAVRTVVDKSRVQPLIPS